MKKIIGLFLVLFISNQTFSQASMPNYYDVLKKYFSTYEDVEEYENYTNFAKKKDGWYVQKVNRLEKDKLLSEYLFWDIETQQYKDISNYFTSLTDSVEWEKKVEPYLTYDWYSYDRVRYFGYNKWALDMIKDFGNATGLSDTMYEGLSRAYNNNAYNYLWYQQGGTSDYNDTMQIELLRLQIPSKERINKVEENILKSVVCVKKLKDINRNYETIVGNVDLKVFNQQMNGYNQMYLVGDFTKEINFINDISLDDRYIAQAKNYLNSCDKNGILFTYGDNDTYQLWYVQKKLGYRTDVSVINTSLLGIPSYIYQLRNRKEVKITAPNLFLEDYGSDVSYYQENSKIKKQSVLLLSKFLENIYLKKEVTNSVIDAHPTSKTAGYSSKEITLLNQLKTKKNIVIKLKNYLLLNDLMMLDLIQSNITNRPIYFTTNTDTYFDDYLTQSGIVYKVDFQKNIQSKKQEIENIENFIQKKYIPITSNFSGSSNFILVDGDKSLVSLYTKIISYYISKNDKSNSKKWVDSFVVKISNFTIEQIPSLRIAEELLVKSEAKKFALKILEMDALYLYKAYINPTYLRGFYSKVSYNEQLLRLNYLRNIGNLKSTIITDLLNKISM